MKVSTKSPRLSRENATAPTVLWRRFGGTGTLALLLALPPAALLGWLTGGATTALNAAAGVAFAGVFLTVGLAGLHLVMRSASILQLPGALTLYSLQILVLLALWVEFERGNVVLPPVQAVPFGLGALAATLCWQAALAAVLLRTRVAMDLGMPEDESENDASEARHPAASAEEVRP